MIKKLISKYSGSIIFIAVVLSTLLSIKYLDAGIAKGVMQLLLSNRALHKVTRHIPDILPHLVGIGTLLMWIIYFYRSRHNKNDVETQFLRLAATVLPAAYVFKTLLKYLFGRTSVRSWLLHHAPLQFNWFNPIWGGSFPSGHMTVFTAFGAAVIFYYPQYKKIVIVFLILLGIALIGTDYHFLSDVIAGTYLGFISTYFIHAFYKKKDKKSGIFN